MIKLLGGSTAILGVLLVIAGMHIKALNAEKDLLENQVVDLKDNIEQQKATIETNTKLHNAGLEREKDLRNDLQQSRNQAQEFSNEINELRLTEHAKALRAPFERGNAAADRMERIWMRFGGTADQNSIAANATEAETVRNTNP